MKILLLLALACLPGVCGAEAFPLSGELWATPRSGETVRAAPAVRRTVEAYLARPKSRIRLHHHKRDETTAQAEELRGWLIALGIEAGRIELIEDSPTDVMTLEVLDNK